MNRRDTWTAKRHRQRGMTLWMVAAYLVILLGISALAIDLAALYVARDEAQRAADAAALAGAKKFVDSGFLSGLVSQATAESQARAEAIGVGAQNVVGGQPAAVAPADVTFNFGTPTNPLIQVTVRRTTASGNPMPTFFGKALGFLNADVSATATAEAYTSSGGGGPPVGTGCLKPWILPNCDPTHSSPENPNCPGSAYFVDPSTGAIANPGLAPGGTVGAELLLKAGDPGEAPVPSHFYPIQIPPGDEPSLCPPCAQNAGSTGTGVGAAIYEKNISCCNTNQLYCGQQLQLDRQTGNMVGPTSQGVACLIHQQSPSCGGGVSGCGQDYLLNPPTNISIVGGTNNPNPVLRGQIVSSSDSTVTVPLYAGENPCPGGATTCASVTIVGFLEVFVNKVGPPQGTVTGYVMNIAGCGSGGSGGGAGGGGSGGSGGSGTGGGSGSGGTGTGNSGTITGSGGTLYPVRLVRP